MKHTHANKLVLQNNRSGSSGLKLESTQDWI